MQHRRKRRFSRQVLENVNSHFVEMGVNTRCLSSFTWIARMLLAELDPGAFFSAFIPY